MSRRARNRTRRIAPAALGLALIGSAAAGPMAASAEDTAGEATPTYSVTVENLTAGQWLTPPNYALHNNQVSVFQRNRPASPGVQAVAENGEVPVLAAELSSLIDAAGTGVSGVGPGINGGPIPPGGSVTFDVTGEENRFSLVSMVVCTNDGFAGLDSFRVPNAIGASRTVLVMAWDAGTEINTERHDDLVPAPFCGGGGAGTGMSDPELAENGTISRHRTIQGVGDLGPIYDWRGRVVEVTVTRTS